MRKQSKICAYVLSLAILCTLTVPASAETGAPSADVGGTVIRDSGGYVHTLSNPILYTWKKPLFNNLPKTHDFFWMDEAEPYEGQNHDVYVVPAGTVLHVDKTLWLWDCRDCDLVFRDGTWYRGPAKPDLAVDESGTEGLTEYTFTDSGTFYRFYFTLKSNPASYTDTVFFYTPGKDAAFQAPVSYQPGTPTTPTTPTPPAVTQQPSTGTGAKESPITVDPNAEAWGVDNSGLNNYTKYGRTVGSYLYQRSDGLLTRVHLMGTGAVAEVYDQNFQIGRASCRVRV